MSDERTGGNSDDREQPAQDASALSAADRLRHTITEDRAHRLGAKAIREPDPPRNSQARERGVGQMGSVAIETLRHADRGDGERGEPLEIRELQRHVDARLDRLSDPQSRSRQGVLQAIRETRRTEQASAEVRVVLGDKVRSRLQPDTRSKVTRRLERGTVVRAVERHKSWTLIECDAGSGAGFVRGWVYNKYLQPFGDRS